MKPKQNNTKQNRYGTLLVQEIPNPTNTEIAKKLHVGADISFWMLKEALGILPALFQIGCQCLIFRAFYKK